jgi:hypothetical protein
MIKNVRSSGSRMVETAVREHVCHEYCGFDAHPQSITAPFMGIIICNTNQDNLFINHTRSLAGLHLPRTRSNISLGYLYLIIRLS